MTGVARFGSVSLEAPDAGVLARFYADVLGVEVAFESDGFCAVKLGPQLWLSTQRVADYRPLEWPAGSVPQQMHLDLAVDDLDAAEAAAVATGARKDETQPSPERWRVLLDPAGHPFCITTLLPD